MVKCCPQSYNECGQEHHRSLKQTNNEFWGLILISESSCLKFLFKRFAKVSKQWGNLTSSCKNMPVPENYSTNHSLYKWTWSIDLCWNKEEDFVIHVCWLTLCQVVSYPTSKGCWNQHDRLLYPLWSKLEHKCLSKYEGLEFSCQWQRLCSSRSTPLCCWCLSLNCVGQRVLQRERRPSRQGGTAAE